MSLGRLFAPHLRFRSRISSSHFARLQWMDARRWISKDASSFNNFINADKFILDRNPGIQRIRLLEKEVAGNLMVIEKALPEADRQSIIDFYVTHFCNNEVLTATLGMFLSILQYPSET